MAALDQGYAHGTSVRPVRTALRSMSRTTFKVSHDTGILTPLPEQYVPCAYLIAHEYATQEDGEGRHINW